MLTLDQLQQTVEEFEDWERVAMERVRAKRELSRHEIDAQIAQIQRVVADRIGRAIQQTAVK